MKIKMNNILYFFFYSEKVNIILLRNALKFLDHIKANSVQVFFYSFSYIITQSYL